MRDKQNLFVIWSLDAWAVVHAIVSKAVKWPKGAVKEGVWMGFSEQDVMNWFTQYAYQPLLIYAGIFLLMLASGFGLPFPEEFTLVSAGLVCYVGSRPDLYPPPSMAGDPANAYAAASVAFFSVVFSDCLVFYLGRRFGGQFLRSRFAQRFKTRMDQVASWTKRYGMWAAGAFRFTPGLRFPGHFACGMMGLSVTKFVMVDAAAAAISVPTQVLLVAFYGETILIYFRQFKIGLAVLIGLAIVYYVISWIRRKSRHKKLAADTKIS